MSVSHLEGRVGFLGDGGINREEEIVNRGSLVTRKNPEGNKEVRWVRLGVFSKDGPEVLSRRWHRTPGELADYHHRKQGHLWCQVPPGPETDCTKALFGVLDRKRARLEGQDQTSN